MGVGKIVDRLVGFLVPQNGLNVFARLRKGDGLHELVDSGIRTRRLPIDNATVARVVSGQRVLLHAAESVEHLPQITRAQPDIHVGIEQLEGLEVGNSLLVCHGLAHRRQQLHQAVGVGIGNRRGIELRLLPDERGYQVRIEIVFRRLGFDRVPPRFRKKNPPVGKRNGLDGDRSRIRNGPLERAHRPEGLAIGGVNLSLGQRSPRRGVGIGLDLERNVLRQAGIGQQARLGQMGAVLGEAVDEVRHGQRLNAIQLWLRRSLRVAWRRGPRQAVCACWGG